MKLQIFAVKDRAINAYMRPWFAQTQGQATRMFQDEVNNRQGEINKHADDYDLWHLATFDDNMGTIEMLPEGPQQLALGKQLKEQA